MRGAAGRAAGVGRRRAGTGERREAEIDALGIANVVVFTGQRPAEEIPAYLDAATVLASPRSTGTNTPLKIYQYLRSGRPIVATDLRTHAQVLERETAFLAEPHARAFGAAILAGVDDPDVAAARAGGARVAETKYSDEAFIAKTACACGLLIGGRASQVAGGVA